MSRLTRLIPLWIKEPLMVFLQEAGRIPLGLAVGHVYRNAIDIRPTPPQKRLQIHGALQKKTYAYLEKKYKQLALELTKSFSQGMKSEEPIIWLFWWRGEETAPNTIRRCIASVRAHAGDIRVQVVDHRNFRDFVDVPAFLIEKLERGTLSITHFSDYYRMALLAAYGGLWLDASIFVSKPLPKSVLMHPFFTVRNPDGDPYNVSQWEWTVSVMSGWRGNTLFASVQALLAEYWKDHDGLVDYYLFDYMIRLLYHQSGEIRQMISAIHPNNDAYYYFQRSFEKPFDEMEYAEQVHSDTCLYKLTWKKEYPRETAEGKATLYDHWLKETDRLL